MRGQMAVIFFFACGTPPSSTTEGAAQKTTADQNIAAYAGGFSAQTLTLPSFDGTPLDAVLFQPTKGATHPAVIFINSWTLDEFEYTVPATKLAQAGYVVLTYCTRGFGNSGGYIDTAGPNDRADFSAMLDWLIANAPVDTNNIASVGISYGGGVSLMAASLDARVKTAVAMSGWGDLNAALDAGNTPRLAWGLILIGSGYVTGRMDPSIAENFAHLLDESDLASIQAWAADRSPINFIDALNAANKPIFISNNFEDDLFNPNQALKYYEALTGPKKLDLNEGVHGTAEAGGLVGVENPVWDDVYAWLDYWLKGTDNGIMNAPSVTMQERFSGPRVTFDAWPSASVSPQTFYPFAGGIGTNASGSSEQVQVYSGLDTLASTGVPILSDIVADYASVPVTTPLWLIDHVNGAVYESDALPTTLQVRGNLSFHTEVASSEGDGELVVYFYDVDWAGVGTLITHGVASFFAGDANAPADIDVALNAVAYDIAAGHHIGIAIDTEDPLYAQPLPLLYELTTSNSPADPTTLTIDTLSN